MSKAKIYYHDIGDYLSREEKLKIIQDFKSMSNLPLKVLKPNEHGDWINKRNEAFETFIPMAPEKKFDRKSHSFFNTYAIGVATNRDDWVYNSSIQKLDNNMKNFIAFYNEQQFKYQKEKVLNDKLKVDDFIDTNPEKIKWTRALRKDVERGLQYNYIDKEVTIGLYRPFFKQYLYFDKPFIESPGLSPRFFPNKNLENLVITISGVSASKSFSVLLSNCIPDLQVQFNGQYFPLYYYEEREKANPGL